MLDTFRFARVGPAAAAPTYGSAAGGAPATIRITKQQSPVILVGAEGCMCLVAPDA